MIHALAGIYLKQASVKNVTITASLVTLPQIDASHVTQICTDFLPHKHVLQIAHKNIGIIKLEIFTIGSVSHVKAQGASNVTQLLLYAQNAKVAIS
jgi:hypothetical protein